MPQRPQALRKVGRQRAVDLRLRPSDRVRKLQQRRVQQHARHRHRARCRPQLHRSAVKRVTEDRMPTLGQMHADLVRAAGVRPGLKQQRARKSLQHPERRLRRVAAAVYRTELAGLAHPTDHAEMVLHFP